MEDAKELYAFYAGLLKDYHHDYSIAKGEEEKSFCKKLILKNNENICHNPSFFEVVIQCLEDEMSVKEKADATCLYEKEAVHFLQLESLTQTLISLENAGFKVSDGLLDKDNEEMSELCSIVTNSQDVQYIRESLSDKVGQTEQNGEAQILSYNYLTVNNILNSLNSIFPLAVANEDVSQ